MRLSYELQYGRECFTEQGVADDAHVVALNEFCGSYQSSDGEEVTPAAAIYYVLIQVYTLNAWINE